MSFSGKLNANNADCDTNKNVIPLSISKYQKFDGDCHPALASLQDLEKPVLAKHLIDCKAKLLDYSSALKQASESHERQLVALSRQLLDLECGLRKRERELCAILQQRDRVIREQSHIIRFLTAKTGIKKRDIKTLANEAQAKMPHFSEMTKAKSEMAITSILESESENDSAVILDEASSSAATSTVVRSVSDVMFPDHIIDEEGASSSSVTLQTSKHLLRNGSYERYKIRSRMQQHQGFSKLLGNVTLPRNRSAKRNNQVKQGGSKTVIVINDETAKSTPNNSHRSVIKPRDVKNKSNNNRTKMILKMSPPCSQSPSPPLGIFNKYVQQSGSVYCSLFGDADTTHSEDDVSYA